VNGKIRHLAIALMALYVVLFLALNYWQIDRTEELAAQPGNTRAAIREFDRPRGPIISADGVVLAESHPITEPGSDVQYQRTYPTGELFANIVGHSTFGLGTTQVERTESEVLTGGTFIQQVRAIQDLFGQDHDYSGSVQLTVRDDMQRTARDLLGETEGSIVMLNVQTGAVIAMWSWPSYDPNRVADLDYDAAYEYLTELQSDPRDPLLNNAYQQRYMPGSTFKVLTTGAGLDSGTVTLDSSWPSETQWVPPQTNDPIMNYGGSSCGGDLTEVFRRSCNIPFAQIAVEMGPDQFQEYIKRWGVEEPLPIDLPRPAASTIGNFDNIDNELPLLAMRGFGQNDDQMVPLHMAMVAATVANDGVMMKPYVVDARFDHDGNVIDRTEPDVWKRPISRQTSDTLTDLMVIVAESGTARCCIALEGGIPVAAKTGTAQLNGPGEPERSHAWIIAFAPADAPKYAVAVMIKGTNAEISASTGGQLAGPLAKQMLDAVFAIDPPTTR